jgi:membrane protein DedA with SNARE-associated domain
MIEHILLLLATLIKAVISAIGYPGIIALMAVESACVPLPSEVIMPFAGYLVYAGRFSSLVVVATLGAIGCNLGSILAYEVGAYGGRPLIERFGKYILMNHHDLDVSDRFFQKYGRITVFLGRLLPVVRTFIALPAGIAHMNRARFHLYTFAGSWPWCFALAYCGFHLGLRWDTDPRLKQWMHRFDALIVLALAIAIIYFVQSHWRNRLRASAEAAAESTAD